jgi:methylmalonyl-CoA mutase
MPNPKFYPFPESSHTEWLEQIKKDSKGKSDNSILKSTLWDEIDIAPVYSFEQRQRDSNPVRFNSESKFTGLPPRIWSNIVSPNTGEEKSINIEISEVLQLGAEGLVLHLDGTEDLNLILKDVLPAYIRLYFLPLGEAGPVLTQVKNWVTYQQLTQEMLHGAILWSPTGELFKGKTNLEEQMSLAVGLISAYKSFPDFHPITIDFARYSNAGGTGIQELTYGLGELIEILDRFTEQGISVNQAIAKIAFHTAIGENHFPEIAKMKTIRSILLDLVSNLGGNLDSEAIHLFASTSDWSKSSLDPNTSLIRQTYEAMAAVIGGCNSLWVKPILGQGTDVLSKRIARNVSTILGEESYLNKVIDPSAGSYYLESLQNEISDLVLKQLGFLEDSGGWTANFINRTIHTQIKNTAIKTQRAVLEKRKILIGVNSYELQSKDSFKITQQEIKYEDYELRPSRASYLVETEKSNQL